MPINVAPKNRPRRLWVSVTDQMDVGRTELPWKAFEATKHSFHPSDYVSEGLALVNVDNCFPNKRMGDIDSIQNPLFRKHIRHAWYIDPSFPDCGFLTRDEAHILLNNALQFSPDTPALEIGCHVGWSTVHIALSGMKVDVIDPKIGQDPRVFLPLVESLRRANVHQTVMLYPGYSPAEVVKLGTNHGRRWGFIFIDGDHWGDGPLNDAVVCEQYAAEDAMILFHDLAFPDVAAGLNYLAQQGWKTAIYHTQQIMGVAWRGRVKPIRHNPDPSYDWSVPEHVAGIPITKERDW